MNSEQIRGPFGWSMLSIAVIIAFFVYAIATIASPLFNSVNVDDAASGSNRLIEKHHEYAELDIERFNGRSAFFKPIRIVKHVPPPPPPPPKPEDEIIPEVRDPGPPPPPATYTGPKLIAIIGEEAWFRGIGSGPDAVIRIKVGEAKDGLKVVKTLEPALVSVEHRNGKYELDLFSAHEDFFREEPPPAAKDDFFEEVES